MKYDWSALTKGLQNMEIEINERQLEQFDLYYDMLIEKNKLMNLTTITEQKEVIEKHFLDSLSLVYAVEPEDISRVIDVGTGAGFPGLPLKIVFPHIEMVLMDSLSKRIGFLNEVIEALELKKIKAIHARAEDLGHDRQYRERFDVCVSRAVSQLPILSEYCVPFLEVGGLFIAYKGQDVTEECKKSERALSKLGAVVADVVLFELSESEYQRSLVVVEKEERTPSIYPRKAGTPEKKPL